MLGKSKRTFTPSSGDCISRQLFSPRHPPGCFPSPLEGLPAKSRHWVQKSKLFRENSGFFRTFSVFLPSFCRTLSVLLPPFFHNRFTTRFGSSGCFSPEIPMFLRKQRLFSVHFPYVFRGFSAHLPYFFRTLLDRVEGPIFREAPSSLPAPPVSSRSSPMTGKKSG